MAYNSLISILNYVNLLWWKLINNIYINFVIIINILVSWTYITNINNELINGVVNHSIIQYSFSNLLLNIRLCFSFKMLNELWFARSINIIRIYDSKI